MPEEPSAFHLPASPLWGYAGVMLIMSVIMVAAESVSAQTIETVGVLLLEINSP